MALYNSTTMDGSSNLPSNSHAAMVLEHRCAVVFATAASLTTADTLVLGKLPAGYIIDSINADTEGVAGLSLSFQQTDSLTAPTKTTVLAADLSVASAGQKTAVMNLAAIRLQGENIPMNVVAKVVGTGSMAAGKEIGVTIKYRSRQSI